MFRPLLLALLICCVVTDTRAQQTVGDGEPLRAELRITVNEAWSVGSDDLLIGEVPELLVDHDGTIYFLDSQMQAVQVIAADGTWLRSLGREGEGPGEFREPMDLFILPDGRLGVLQQQPPKIALLSKQGDALDDHPLAASTTGYRVLMTGSSFEGGLVLVNMQFRPREDGNLGTAMVLTTVDEQGALIAELLQHEGGVDYAALSADEEDLDNFVGYWTVTTDARIAAVPTFDRYRIEVFETSGELVHAIERPFTPRERTEAEKAAVAAGTERSELRFDEFDAKGNYVGAVVVRGAFGGAEAGIFVRGHRLFVVRGGGESEEEIGEVTVSCYEMTSPSGGPLDSARAGRD